MAFHRTNGHRGMELTTLIDMVFLLLIFFLVSFAFSVAGDVSESRVYTELDLPKNTTELPAIPEDRLESLMIQIVPDTSQRFPSRRVYMLWPSFDDTLKITRTQAFAAALRDSTFATFPAGFLDLLPAEFQQTLPCTLITHSIDRFLEMEKFYNRNIHPIIEIRAERNTEFKIISFILNQCSAYQDAIPQVIIRTGL
jgi:hypothetical protein